MNKWMMQNRGAICVSYMTLFLYVSHTVYYYCRSYCIFSAVRFTCWRFFLFYKMAVKALCQKIIKQQFSHTSEKEWQFSFTYTIFFYFYNVMVKVGVLLLPPVYNEELRLGRKERRLHSWKVDQKQRQCQNGQCLGSFRPVFISMEYSGSFPVS